MPAYVTGTERSPKAHEASTPSRRRIASNPEPTTTTREPPATTPRAGNVDATVGAAKTLALAAFVARSCAAPRAPTVTDFRPGYVAGETHSTTPSPLRRPRAGPVAPNAHASNASARNEDPLAAKTTPPMSTTCAGWIA